MEQNLLPVVAKKLSHIVRVAFFMLRKGISKAKLTLELNLLLKRRRKIASKSAVHDLIFHNIHHISKAATKTHSSPEAYNYYYPHKTPIIDEYECFFSCSNTPAHAFFNISPFHLKKRELPRAEENYEEHRHNSPGFGAARQLRVSDSPFVLVGVDEEDIEHVDEAAEEFITRFYRELKKQNGMV